MLSSFHLESLNEFLKCIFTSHCALQIMHLLLDLDSENK